MGLVEQQTRNNHNIIGKSDLSRSGIDSMVPANQLDMCQNMINKSCISKCFIDNEGHCSKSVNFNIRKNFIFYIT